ncbi:MAG: c-type cytochrome [Silvibacterium sp.]
MKRFQNAALLAAIAGLFTFQAMPGNAASGSQTSQQAAPTPASPGAEAYASHCAICHGDRREGILPAFPPLLGIGRQLTDAQITELIHTGKGRMPAFPKVQGEELTELLRFLSSPDMSAPQTSGAQATNAGGNTSPAHPAGLSEAGGALFRQNCAFCHGRDAMGGETGPDLTQSRLVRADRGGDRISEVIRDGRPEKKMPAFNFSSQELLSLAAFIHAQEAAAVSKKGGRRGVEVADLQTGNVEKGKEYFDGAGGCVKCHSATGDLAGIASRFEGLQLEEQMLYPRDVKNQVTVTLPSGEKLTGTLEYQDEFTIGMRDDDKTYHSWPVGKVKFKVDSPVDAHVELFSKYTDDDIHNLMAYLQTLR